MGVVVGELRVERERMAVVRVGVAEVVRRNGSDYHGGQNSHIIFLQVVFFYETLNSCQVTVMFRDCYEIAPSVFAIRSPVHKMTRDKHWDFGW